MAGDIWVGISQRDEFDEGGLQVRHEKKLAPRMSRATDAFAGAVPGTAAAVAAGAGAGLATVETADVLDRDAMAAMLGGAGGAGGVDGGTTIMAVTYKDGVIMGADSRTSTGASAVRQRTAATASPPPRRPPCRPTLPLSP